MNPLLFWSFVVYAGLLAITAISEIFAEKPRTTSVRMRHFNGLSAIYFFIIIFLFLLGVLQ